MALYKMRGLELQSQTRRSLRGPGQASLVWCGAMTAVVMFG